MKNKDDIFRPFSPVIESERRSWRDYRQPATRRGHFEHPVMTRKRAKSRSVYEPDIDARVIYFAFGSNMDSTQMKRRCPSAQGGEVATLDGYRLTFCGFSSSWGGGVATIVRDEGASVLGRVWEITWDDLRQLDAFEGHPYVYRRRILTLNDGQRPMVYIKPVDDDENGPSEAYFRTIANGYLQADLDLENLVDAAGALGIN